MELSLLGSEHVTIIIIIIIIIIYNNNNNDNNNNNGIVEYGQWLRLVYVPLPLGSQTVPSLSYQLLTATAHNH
jgi:hypothetical protein